MKQKEPVEWKFHITNGHYIEHLLYKRETGGAVCFGRKKDNKGLWVPKSLIKGGWNKDTSDEQTIYFTFPPQKDFGWQERKKK